MDEPIRVGVTSLVPWTKNIKPRERVMVELDPKKSRASDLLDLVGLDDPALRNVVLVVVEGVSLPFHTALRGGEEVVIVSALSGG